MIPPSLIERARHWANDPDAVAFVGAEGAVRFSQLLSDAEALAASLAAEGVGVGDVISFQLPNWIEATVINIAASCLGAVCSPIVPIYRGSELPFMLNDSASKVVFFPGTFRSFDYPVMYSALQAELEHTPLLVAVRARGYDGSTYERLIGEPRGGGSFGPPPSADQDKLRLYTSGTTGQPKAVRHSQRTLDQAMHNSIRFWNIAPGDIVLMPSPVTHATGYVNALELPFLHGTQALLMERWDADEAVDLINRYGVTMTVGATPFLVELTEAARRAGSDLPTLRIFACGGAAVPPDAIRAANAVMRNQPAFRIYGSSEAPYVTLGVEQRGDDRAATTDGRIVGYDVRILDEEGDPVEGDAAGEIIVKGASLFLGYARSQDMAGAMTDDGFFLTGDVGRVDADGMLTITDRKKDIIIRGGENISAKEVEDALHRHPDVAEAAVVAAPHPRLVEGVFAFVIPRVAHTRMDFRGVAAFLESQGLSRQKIPEGFSSVAEFPRTPSGKIRKDVLRQRAAEESSIRHGSA